MNESSIRPAYLASKRSFVYGLSSAKSAFCSMLESSMSYFEKTLDSLLPPVNEGESTARQSKGLTAGPRVQMFFHTVRLDDGAGVDGGDDGTL